MWNSLFIAQFSTDEEENQSENNNNEFNTLCILWALREKEATREMKRNEMETLLLLWFLISNRSKRTKNRFLLWSNFGWGKKTFQRMQPNACVCVCERVVRACLRVSLWKHLLYVKISQHIDVLCLCMCILVPICLYMTQSTNPKYLLTICCAAHCLQVKSKRLFFVHFEAHTKGTGKHQKQQEPMLRIHTHTHAYIALPRKPIYYQSNFISFCFSFEFFSVASFSTFHIFNFILFRTIRWICAQDANLA